MQLGYKLIAEEYAPKELVRLAVRAEQAGFDFVELSDHYHPWLNATAHSPFAWSVLAAAAALRDPEMARRIAEMGSPEVSGTPEAFRALIAAETAKWRLVLLANGGEGGVSR